MGQSLASCVINTKAVRTLPQGAYTPVLLDSGVRRGTDVLKALALGNVPKTILQYCLVSSFNVNFVIMLIRVLP